MANIIKVGDKVSLKNGKVVVVTRLSYRDKEDINRTIPCDELNVDEHPSGSVYWKEVRECFDWADKVVLVDKQVKYEPTDEIKEKKALVLMFSVDNFTLDELDGLSPEARYQRAVEGVSDGVCDIYTLGDLCGDINNEYDYFGEWFAYPCYVDEDEYLKWMK